MILHNFTPRHETSPKDIYHCDVQLKCPVCSYVRKYGVPISKKEFDLLRTSTVKSMILTDELKDIYDEEVILQRLESIGYW